MIYHMYTNVLHAAGTILVNHFQWERNFKTTNIFLKIWYFKFFFFLVQTSNTFN